MKSYEELWNEQMKIAEVNMRMANSLLAASKIAVKILRTKLKRRKELEETILRMKWNNELE